MPIPSPGWMLDHIPMVSYFTADDENNSLRLLCGAEGSSLRRAIEQHLKNGALSDAEFNPADRQTLWDHREAAWMGRDPVISRLTFPSDRGARTCLLASHAVYEGESRAGVTGVAVDVTGVPELEGPSGVLGKGSPGKNWNQRVNVPEQPDAEWLVHVLPVAFVVSENDPNYTIRHLSGSMERVVGYTSEEILSGRLKSWTLIDPTEVDMADERLESAIAAGQSVILRVPLAHESGAVVPILAFVAPYLPPGHPNGFFVSAVLGIDAATELQGSTTTFIVPR